jgi:hypothetical protein
MNDVGTVVGVTTVVIGVETMVVIGVVVWVVTVVVV